MGERNSVSNGRPAIWMILLWYLMLEGFQKVFDHACSLIWTEIPPFPSSICQPCKLNLACLGSQEGFGLLWGYQTPIGVKATHSLQQVSTHVVGWPSVLQAWAVWMQKRLSVNPKKLCVKLIKSLLTVVTTVGVGGLPAGLSVVTPHHARILLVLHTHVENTCD